MTAPSQETAAVIPGGKLIDPAELTGEVVGVGEPGLQCDFGDGPVALPQQFGGFERPDADQVIDGRVTGGPFEDRNQRARGHVGDPGDGGDGPLFAVLLFQAADHFAEPVETPHHGVGAFRVFAGDAYEDLDGLRQQQQVAAGESALEFRAPRVQQIDDGEQGLRGDMQVAPEAVIFAGGRARMLFR